MQLVNVRRGTGSVDASSGGLPDADRQERGRGRPRGRPDGAGRRSVLARRHRRHLLPSPGAWSSSATPRTTSCGSTSTPCKATIKGGRGDDDLEIAGSDGELPFPKSCGAADPARRSRARRGDDVDSNGRGGPDEPSSVVLGRFARTRPGTAASTPTSAGPRIEEELRAMRTSSLHRAGAAALPGAGCDGTFDAVTSARAGTATIVATDGATARRGDLDRCRRDRDSAASVSVVAKGGDDLV